VPDLATDRADTAWQCGGLSRRCASKRPRDRAAHLSERGSGV